MIYITLTTIPSRLNSRYRFDMRYCLESLLTQSYDEYEVHLNIPDKLKYTDEEYIIPDWLIEFQEKYTNLKVFKGVEDLGPATKLVPTVERVSNPEDLIIVVDDDLVYKDGLIQAHINNQERYENAAVGYDGLQSLDKFYGDVRDYYCGGIKKDSRVKVLQHYKSVSYKRRYFDENFKNFVLENLTWNDDVLISAYMKDRGFEKIVTHHDDDSEFNTIEEWHAGVGTTFPIIRHTEHESKEGCNLFRQNEGGGEVVDRLYKNYIG